MLKNKYVSFLFIVLITFSASAMGGFVTASFKEPWYSQIIQPSFSPPSWVFGPVWTTLYFLMSLAIWLFWINFKNKKVLYIYLVHIFFNAIWSINFFWISSNFLSIFKFNYNINFYYMAYEHLL